MKTIVSKLNLHKYEQIAVLDKPDYVTELEELTKADYELVHDQYDCIFAFVLDMEQLRTRVNEVVDKKLLRPNGYLFAAYPKKGNKVYSAFIHRDELLAGVGSDEEGYIGESDIKFSRMVGMDDVFTVVGFKREARSQSRKATGPSQRVADYESLIPAIEADLRDTPELLAFYHTLTPGYRRDWARYVYSTTQEATREKRRDEMKKILGQGFKSHTLYRQNQN